MALFPLLAAANRERPWGNGSWAWAIGRKGSVIPEIALPRKATWEQITTFFVLRARYRRLFSLPSAIIPIADLEKFCSVVAGLFPDKHPDKFEITFRGINGQPLIAENAQDINPDDAFVPDSIVDPIVIASKSDERGNPSHLVRFERALSTQTDPIFGNPGSGYKMTLESADPTWLVHADTVGAWLRMHKRWYSARVAIFLPGLLLMCLSLAGIFSSGHANPNNPTVSVVTNPYLLFSGFAGFIVGALFIVLSDNLFPHITIIVRPKQNWLTAALVLTLLTAVGIAVNIWSVIITTLRK